MIKIILIHSKEKNMQKAYAPDIYWTVLNLFRRGYLAEIKQGRRFVNVSEQNKRRAAGNSLKSQRMG